ncbi:8272_t:CDS:2 [Paraglomus occultum]|uniref:8272_t:CDS:1 n=1 Tax=Paraglomus occultum TaxID=144539 RepID=A0A9N8ZF53_9GLOM|nr:8272_t:CDS:2 [Paraglomus occultum]
MSFPPLFSQSFYSRFPYFPSPVPPPGFTPGDQPRNVLRFRDFHRTHFLPNRDFFRQALNPSPNGLWNIIDNSESTEWSEWTKRQGVEFVLSEEAIAMFRFSEMRREELKSSSKGQPPGSPTLSDSSSSAYVTEIPPSHTPACPFSQSDYTRLYGNNHEEIRLLESLVNFKFQTAVSDGNKDGNDVVYWPVLPLRFV